MLRNLLCLPFKRTLPQLHSMKFSQIVQNARRLLKTERFARETSLNMQDTTPCYQKISSPSPAGAMKIFLWIRYKRIFSFIAHDISWKEIPLFLAPTVFHPGNCGGVSILALSRRKKRSTRRRNSVCEKVTGAIRLVIWYASLRGILQIAREMRGA